MYATRNMQLYSKVNRKDTVINKSVIMINPGRSPCLLSVRVHPSAHAMNLQTIKRMKISNMMQFSHIATTTTNIWIQWILWLKRLQFENWTAIAATVAVITKNNNAQTYALMIFKWVNWEQSMKKQTTRTRNHHVVRCVFIYLCVCKCDCVCSVFFRILELSLDKISIESRQSLQQRHKIVNVLHLFECWESLHASIELIDFFILGSPAYPLTCRRRLLVWMCLYVVICRFECTGCAMFALCACN